MRFLLAVGLWLLSAMAPWLAQAAPAKPPLNILFCFADDWGRYAGAYAPHGPQPNVNQILKTPHLDRVAREGVLFLNAFVNSPSCTPCRSSLLSGRYFFATGRGAILRGAVWDESIPSFPLLLRDAGYHIGKSYKVWGPGRPADAPYGGQLCAYEKAGRAFNDFSENVTRMMATNVPLAEAKERVLRQVRRNFADFLAARPAGKPFCYWFGPTLTHRAWERGSGKALWGIDPESLKGRLPPFLPDVPEVREDFADYLGEVQAWDAGVGVLLEELEKAGELERTLIVISGDHGAPGFPNGKCNLYDFGVQVALIARWPGTRGGRVVEDFTVLMDLAPTFLEAGGLPPAPGMHGRSLAPILTSHRSGQVDPRRTWVITGRERHVDTAREGNLPYPHRALRTRDFLYIRNFAPERWPMGAPLAVTATSAPPFAVLASNTRVAFPDFDASPTKAWLIEQRHAPEWQKYYDLAFGRRPAEELYDLRRDPHQTRNVAGQSEYAKIQRQLSRQLMEELKRAGDPRVLGDGQTFERPPFTDVEPEAPPPKAGAAPKKSP
ncbi:sulfatase [Fontisphaera persica]|uniref:sulfatase family protein n=1 Tax=Fontisphaera persica TaxID=2974023 RepID=UPI0024BF72EE|nr:sulfatase [Fontisphaera persica]WCJ58937.1 sulfatase [Fontisphaera persica]